MSRTRGRWEVAVEAAFRLAVRPPQRSDVPASDAAVRKQTMGLDAQRSRAVLTPYWPAARSSARWLAILRLARPRDSRSSARVARLAV